MTLSLIFNLFTTFGAVILIIVSASIFIAAYSDNQKLITYKNFFIKYSMRFIWVASFMAVAGSLVYSEIFKYEPCVLCWWQRIFIYPVFVIIFAAMIKKCKNQDSQIVSTTAENPYQYINPLMWIALIFSLYHNYILVAQQSGNDPFFCNPEVAGACTDRYVEILSVIDIPFMALAIILFILVISTLSSRAIDGKK